MRGNWQAFAAHHQVIIIYHPQDCVRRRTRLSLMGISNEAEVDRAIDEVWPYCIKDTAPFIEIPF